MFLNLLIAWMDILLFRNCNIRNNHFALVEGWFYSFHIHKKTDKHRLALFRFSQTHDFQFAVYWQLELPANFLLLQIQLKHLLYLYLGGLHKVKFSHLNLKNQISTSEKSPLTG